MGVKRVGPAKAISRELIAFFLVEAAKILSL